MFLLSVVVFITTASAYAGMFLNFDVGVSVMAIPEAPCTYIDSPEYNVVDYCRQDAAIIEEGNPIGIVRIGYRTEKKVADIFGGHVYFEQMNSLGGGRGIGVIMIGVTIE